MLKPSSKKSSQMTAEQKSEYAAAVAVETAGKQANVEAAREVVPAILAEAAQAVDVVARLRSAREAANVSLSDLEARTGIHKSVLSRLENSKAPNPTIATLQRYAAAIGLRLDINFLENSSCGQGLNGRS